LHGASKISGTALMVGRLILQVPFAVHVGMDPTSVQGHIVPEQCE
jgi:hypothetical protein